MHFLRFLRFVAPWSGALLLIFLMTSVFRAQTPATNAPAPTAPARASLLTQPPPQPTVDPNSIPPTVTPEMGDVGGKFFGKVPDPAKTKHYYIAAEPVLWNFAPDGQDPVCGKQFPDSVLLYRASWKVRYVQYADPGFTARVLPAERLGIMGPVLRGTTGQYLAVTFLNRAWLPLSMHPHGVRYDKDSEGSYYKEGSGLGAAIAPGAKFTYVWQLNEASAPLPTEPSSKGWLYHSHVDGDSEINLGLIGSIIVTDSARARADGTPKDVDREMAALFLIFNEANLNASSDTDGDDRDPTVPPPTAPVQMTWAQAAEASELGQRHTINGLVFGNLHGLEMNQGERVRWYLYGLGSENDLHTPHWHGMTVVEDGNRRTDVVELLPASMKIADMVADNPGTWLFHCHVSEHFNNGMFARFIVHPTGGPGVSRDPEVAFFGMPQSLTTLRFQTAELLLDKSKADKSEIDLSGQVTVPEPFPLLRNAVSVQIGTRSLKLQPDVSGICASPEGMLMVKNGGAIGVVTDGMMNFDLTLKGAGWLDELRKLHVLDKNSLAPNAALPISMVVGEGHHAATATLKIAVAPQAEKE